MKSTRFATRLLALLIIPALTTLLIATPVGAYTEELDQYNSSNIGPGSAAYRIYGYTDSSVMSCQSFRPGMDYATGQVKEDAINRITQLNVYLRNSTAGAWAEYSIWNSTRTSILYGPWGSRMDGGNYWEVYSLDSFEVTPGSRYVICMEADSEAYWASSSANSYAYGYATKWGSATDDDFGFAIWGYRYEDPVPPDEPPVVPPEEPPDEPPDEPPVDDGDDDDDDGTIPKEDKEDLIAEETDTVNPPALSEVKKNGEEVELGSEGILDVDTDDSIEVTGMADPNTNVIVFVGDFAYSTTTDAEGNWTVLIQGSELGEGDFLVQAQAQDAEGNGSQIVDLFTLDVVLVEADSTSDNGDIGEAEAGLTFWEKLWIPPNLWYLTGILILMFLALLGFIIYYKEQERKKSGIKPKVPIESEKTSI